MKKLSLCVSALLLATGAASSLAASTIFLGGYPNQVMMIDDTNGATLQKVTLDTGLPTSMRLSDDKKKLYVTTNTTSGIEVMDVATRKIINKFSLNTPTTRYRFDGGVVDPTGRYFYILGTRIEKEIDRYFISKLQYMVVDLQQKKVVRSVDLAPEDSTFSYRGNLALSPDGKTLYVFRDKVLVVNTADFKVVERFDLAKPDSPGMEQVSFGGTLDRLRTPGQLISLFNAQDPYVHNKIFGIARFDLTSRQFNFTPVGPAPARLAGLEVTPDGKDGYTVAVNGDIGSQRCEFWHFDLVKNIAVDKAEFPCRRRFYFGMSGDGAKLYVYGAGYDIAVYDSKTLKPVADWETQNDITMAGMVITQ
ncbi:YncE family protein [Sphingobium nicotianae]|uniref:Quinohemoprotein amine dehydrogenase subunit beta n=1 Tax=Sphingobium nicotianae TaxID=2782607 RepID=A0A9X1DCY4_9SPHN|nr:hypothetical protein [Sphingobium nicotianae]MBT2187278.1 hypothetical protein [Sphingobium nicotianae]